MLAKVVICRIGIRLSCKLSSKVDFYGSLTRRRYFLFASALVVLSNEFSALFENPSASTCIENAISIMHYCAEHDPQASRLVFILTSFRDVVDRQKAAGTSHTLSPIRLHLSTQPSSQLFNQNIDPGMSCNQYSLSVVLLLLLSNRKMKLFDLDETKSPASAIPTFESSNSFER